VGEFEGDVGVGVRRHAAWNMERHLVTRRDPGMETCLFSSLLVLPVACRGLGARRQSLLSGLEPLRSLVVCFISSFTVLASLWNRD
jgi:hypothetical protein